MNPKEVNFPIDLYAVEVHGQEYPTQEYYSDKNTAFEEAYMLKAKYPHWQIVVVNMRIGYPNQISEDDDRRYECSAGRFVIAELDTMITEA